MRIPYRPLAISLLVLVFSGLLLDRAQAGGNYFPPVSDPVVGEECGSCHLAFAPSMLPASAWKRMMGDLANHFGDDLIHGDLMETVIGNISAVTENRDVITNT